MYANNLISSFVWNLNALLNFEVKLCRWFKKKHFKNKAQLSGKRLLKAFMKFPCYNSKDANQYLKSVT